MGRNRLSENVLDERPRKTDRRNKHNSLVLAVGEIVLGRLEGVQVLEHFACPSNVHSTPIRLVKLFVFVFVRGDTVAVVQQSAVAHRKRGENKCSPVPP